MYLLGYSSTYVETKKSGFVTNKTWFFCFYLYWIVSI